jgi:hypothetical protein
MKYLVIKGIAGLGNRMLSVATGILYAEITDRRPVVDWSDRSYSDDGADTFHRYFDAPSVGRVDEIPDTASVIPEDWQGHLGGYVRKTGRYTPGYTGAKWLRGSVDLLRTDHDADVLVMWASRERITHLRPHLRGEHAELAPLPTDAILRRVLDTSLAPGKEITDRVAQFRRECLPGPAVGVHVRQSDLRSRLGVIRRKLDRLLTAEPGLDVFLATDNAAVREDFERDYDAVSRPHRYDEPGTALHTGKARSTRYQDGLDALVDMYLLAGCDHLIGDGKSSFTRVTTMLSAAPPAHIIDVQALVNRWHHPVKAVWRHTVPGPAAPLAVAVARFLAR